MAKDQRRRVGTHLLVLGLYALLSMVLTWPLVRHLFTHVPGSYTWAFDEYTFVWNMWWFRHALFDLGQNPLTSTHTFYPLGISLVTYTYNLFNAIISLPLQPYLPLPAISNLTFLFATTFSGYGTFLLVGYLLRDLRTPSGVEEDGQRSSPALYLATLAAFLAGLIYAFGSYRFIYAAIGHYNLWSTTWIPFYTLYLIKTVRELRLQNGVLLGVFLVLAMLCEMLWGVFLGLLTLIVLAFALTRAGRKRVAGGPSGLLKRLAVAALVAILLYSPLLFPVLRDMLVGYDPPGWGDAEKLSMDLLGFFTPTALHPLGGDWVETLQKTLEGTARFRDVNTVFLGWAGLALALVGAIRYRRRLAAWITGAIIFAVFSLGPLLQINGRSLFDLDGLAVNVPLPFILLHYIPIVKANRVPNRFGVVLMLSLAVLAGFGAYWLLGKLRRSRALLVAGCLLLAVLLLFEHWSVPLPLTDARIPPVYQEVAADLEDFAILQLPLGWRNSFGVQGAESTQAQYYQSYHGKRLLSGNISRNPPFKFDYFQRIPILESLINLQTYGEVDAERRAADRANAEQFVDFYDIRYVAVAPGVPGRPPYVDTREEAVAYVEEVLPVELALDQDGWLLYQVSQPEAPASTRIDLGVPDPLTTMALGEGWAPGEEIQGATAAWAVEQDARVFLPAVGDQGYDLTLTALPFDYPGAVEQAVTPEINGHTLERTVLLPGWSPYTWQVPPEWLRPGLNDLRLGFDRLDAPAEVLPGSGQIGGTGVQAPLPLEVNSGGPLDFAFISIGPGEEMEDGSVHRAGYNVAILDPQSGRVLDRQGFDTTPSGSEAEAAALADFISGAPEGHIVAVALQGDGAAHLTEEAVAAFHTIGGQADPRGTTGWSHALIGVKGAPPGAAMEAAGPESGWLYVAPDQRSLAVAVDAILWEEAGGQ